MFDIFEPIKPTLTDMRGCEKVFLHAFKYSLENKYPISSVLELGVYYLPNSILPGQSTKILGVIQKEIYFDKFVSVDLDPRCEQTINMCKQFLLNNNIELKNHKLVVEESLKVTFDDKFDFIFLDTNHDDNYPQRIGFDRSTCGQGYTFKELEHFTKFLNKEGHFFIHDTKSKYVPDSYGSNTEGAIEKFLDIHPEFIFYEHLPNQNGLGELIYKDSELARSNYFGSCERQTV